ncbi:hypothetical protein P3X46_001595 [Hevea brasiliensis]|uniref:Cystatin domain-containing protein n=1 Tax=Hevea brasiliensis TaxID=3981 RepID=A0ABQ9NCX8_HEVBR|nr:uncharacterized protein LOC110651342 [Hevea brasiliensis]XP_058007023.1 uncharacterized protein LOC110651342 [Hevea brasiliensis]XP_058007030.1 uncharacterized protein LOC110651342 [Hevea brasiliensis]KAJ9190384.1 hypothetical protein P3X46_001595 [Hevea brasiliensis]
MASKDDYAAYESLSKIKDGLHGQGPGNEPKVAGSSVGEQLEDEDNKKEINCNMEDEYHLLEDIDPLAWHYDSENEDHVKLLEDFICQYKESDGFDFIPLPGRPILSGIAYPVYLDLDTVYSNGCREALKYAIEKENEKGSNLIFERIDHANMHPPGLFFITFEARNVTTDEVKTYQTRVFRCPFTPSDIEVELFRLKIQPDDK